MKILGIETSCDETAAAIVKNGRKVISNVVASSQKMHAKTGGIIPEMAARQQIRSIVPVVEQAIEDSKCGIDEIDCIAVTTGPGLIGSLLVGVETAKTLSYLWEKPVISVNHLLGHVYANFIDGRLKNKTPDFPAMALVVSGGHTDLVFMDGHDEIKLIGSTRDDAAGEAFDKIARMIGIPYPGGPNLAKRADEFIASHQDETYNFFPRPMIHEKNFEWSFSGLKTAAINCLRTKSVDRNRLAAEVQEAIVDVLVKKSLRAVEKYKPRSFLLAGGVAANRRLRESFDGAFQAQGMCPSLHVPELRYCTDNAAMIAAAGYYLRHKISWKNLTADPSARIVD
jgi:N6-L-threonylcarbamoyladenine synthase